MHILCMNMLHDAWFVVAAALACALKYIYACNYISAADAHTSKLPPRENVVFNMMTQHSQLQAMLCDQSDNSSNLLASHVKLISSERCSSVMTMSCSGLHIRCIT